MNDFVTSFALRLIKTAIGQVKQVFAGRFSGRHDSRDANAHRDMVSNFGTTVRYPQRFLAGH